MAQELHYLSPMKASLPVSPQDRMRSRWRRRRRRVALEGPLRPALTIAAGVDSGTSQVPVVNKLEPVRMGLQGVAAVVDVAAGEEGAVEEMRTVVEGAELPRPRSEKAVP